MKLKSGQEPDYYVTKLENIKSQLVNTHKTTIDYESLIIQVINSLPEEYDSLIDTFHQQMTIGTLEIEDCKEQLRAKFLPKKC